MFRFLAAASCATAVAVIASSSGPASASHLAASRDFNGDGQSDLVVSQAMSGGADPSLEIVVSPGTSSGRPDRAASWSITGADVGITQASARFGASFSTGDFNDDGYTDIAIGAPGYEVRGHPAAGAVVIVYGSASGPDAAGAQLVTQSTSGVAGKAQGYSAFGRSMTTVDINGDGASDLVVGEPKYLGSKAPHTEGAIEVLLGSPHGIAARGSQFIRRRGAGLPGGTLWGSNLAAGHLNGDRFGDIAVSTQDGFANARGHKQIGRVDVLFGTKHGLDEQHPQSVSPASKGFPGPTTGQRFGASLATLAFTPNRQDELVVGATGGHGAVDVIPTASDGLEPAKAQRVTEASKGVPGISSGKAFGSQLAVRLPSKYSEIKHPMLYIGEPFYAVRPSLGCYEGAIVAMHSTKRGLKTKNAVLLLDPDLAQEPTCAQTPGWGSLIGGGSHIVSEDTPGHIRVLHDGGMAAYASTEYDDMGLVGLAD